MRPHGQLINGEVAIIHHSEGGRPSKMGGGNGRAEGGGSRSSQGGGGASGGIKGISSMVEQPFYTRQVRCSSHLFLTC